MSIQRLHPESSAEPLDAETTAAIVEATSMLLVVLDREAQIVRFNAACERATGYSADEMIGQPLWRLVPADALAETRAVLGERIRGHEPPQRLSDHLIGGVAGLSLIHI